MTEWTFLNEPINRKINTSRKKTDSNQNTKILLFKRIVLPFELEGETPVYCTGSIEPKNVPKFKWPDNTFKGTVAKLVGLSQSPTHPV
jgi:hypothetical protein